MTEAVEITTSDLGGWPPGVKHFQVGADFVVVDADLEPVGPGRKVRRRPTVIVAVNEVAAAETLTPTHSFAPGTTHEDALVLAGYEVVGA